MIALGKKGGGIGLIAIGCILCHLVTKVAGKLVVDDMIDLLAPRPLYYVIAGRAEVAAHVARQYIGNLQVVKLDFSKALNCVRRLNMVEAMAPNVYLFVQSEYSSPSIPF